MKSLAVLVQLIGFIVTCTTGTTGFFLGPTLVLAGGIWYRRESKKEKDKNSSENSSPQEINKTLAANKNPKSFINTKNIVIIGVMFLIFYYTIGYSFVEFILVGKMQS